MEQDKNAPAFDELGLPATLLQTLDKLGYKQPSPIQAQAIPHLLAGRDLLGMAQTGTGKTAAFSLPLMAHLQQQFADSGRSEKITALVLAPTRELAQQVAEAMNGYAANAKGCRTLAVYGGAPFGPQARTLRGGVDIVVGTPGRVMDHMRRGNLDVSGLQVLVLDEADEMLRMGFIDDVEWILEQTPQGENARQIALFSATMPKEIARIAKRYLLDPAEVRIKQATTTGASIRQRYVMVHGGQKREALARLLEVEQPEAAMIFVRTKAATNDVAEFLRERGHAAEELSGDLSQEQRDKAVQRLKSGRTDFVVATDVAARGLDVDRISHVINFDMPGDPEVYTHRIGRTGRAGRSGEAILFAQPRERRMLRLIGKVTRSDVVEMEIPSVREMNEVREARLGEKLKAHLNSEQKSTVKVLERLQESTGLSDADLALALAVELNKGRPFLLSQEQEMRSVSGRGRSERRGREERGRERLRGERRPREERRPDSRHEKRNAEKNERGRSNAARESGDFETQRFRIEVGRDHGVQPGNIVGAIANEAGLDSENIGRIELHDRHAFVDLPKGMPKEVFNHLKNVWVCGQKLAISQPNAGGAGRDSRGGSRAGVGRNDRPRPGSGRPSNRGPKRRPDGRRGEEKSAPPKRKKLKMKVGAAKAHGRRKKAAE